MVKNDKKYLQLNDVKAYKIAFQLSNYVWEIVIKFSPFERDTVGKQFTKAVDSISANIAEGFGRYNKRDKIRFYRISYGSVYESFDWNEKSKYRNLITNEQYNHTYSILKELPKEIHSLINFTEEKLSS